MDLTTGRIITRNQWVEVPMPASAIEATEKLAEKQKQPDISRHGYDFSWTKLRSFPTNEIVPADIPDAFLSADEGVDDEDSESIYTTESTSDLDESYAEDASSDEETLDADTDTDNDDNDDSDDDESNGPNDDPDESGANADPCAKNQGARDEPSTNAKERSERCIQQWPRRSER